MNFANFHANLMPAIAKGYDSDFLNTPNIIGSSEIPFGLRKNIINKRENLTLDFQMDLLSGKMTHHSLQKEEVMYYITKEINKQLGYNEIEIYGNRFIELDNGNYHQFKVQKEKEQFIEFYPKQYFRLHSDIHTTYYTIEIKTTTMPIKMWKALAVYNLQQLNTYLGFAHHDYGFLLKNDQKVYTSKSTRESYVWNNFFMLYPHHFSQELFDYTINRVKEYFNHVNNNTPIEKIACPEFLFECKDKCREYCPNPIDKVKLDVNETCTHCKQEIRAGTTALLRNNQMYHYTTEKGERYEECIKACKDAYEVKK